MRRKHFQSLTVLGIFSYSLYFTIMMFRYTSNPKSKNDLLEKKEKYSIKKEMTLNEMENIAENTIQVVLDPKIELDKTEWYNKPNRSLHLYSLCESVIKGDFKENLNLIETVKKEDVKHPDDKLQVDINTDCSKLKDLKGYWTHNVSEEEVEFPVAFSILVHVDTDQVERLFRAIFRPSNVYCIHIDAKSHSSFKTTLLKLFSCFPNVIVPSHTYSVLWGTYTIVEAELSCWKALHDHKMKWKYLINLTGHDFPLKTNREIVKILKALNGTNNIESSELHFQWAYMKFTKPSDPGVARPGPPWGIKVRKGSAHMAASRAYVEYLLTNKKSKTWFEWCKYTRIPDEHCFSTLNYNPHLGVPGAFIGNPKKKPKFWWIMRYKRWDNEGYFCHGHFKHHICNIGLGDLPLVTSSIYLFVNKIQLRSQPAAYRCLEYWIRNRTNMEQNFDVTHYSEISARRSFD